MTLLKLPEINALERPKGYTWDVPSDILARWVDTPQAAADEGSTVNIYDMIGLDPYTGGGFTAKRMSGILRSVGQSDITVKINSPGGDVFEGFAIYNELRQHKAKVTVQVMGIAASAAAYIAMAGDEINIGLGAFMMVHNSWGMVVGNKNDLQASIGILTQIDSAQVDIFEARTGLSRDKIIAYMDAETLFSANDAVKAGFADAVFDAPVNDGAKALDFPRISAWRKMDALMAQAGASRVERRRLRHEVAGGEDVSALTVTQDAGLDATAISRLLETLRT